MSELFNRESIDINVHRRLTDTSFRRRYKRITQKTRHPKQYVRGNARLSMGLYRTPEEANRYIKESLKRPLP